MSAVVAALHETPLWSTLSRWLLCNYKVIIKQSHPASSITVDDLHPVKQDTLRETGTRLHVLINALKHTVNFLCVFPSVEQSQCDWRLGGASSAAARARCLSCHVGGVD